MRIFDPHAHMTSRTTDDYEAMAASGVKVLVEPAFWLGQPRTSVGSFIDYFNSLLGWERFRAAQFGIRHYCTIGLNPKEANDDAPAARGDRHPPALPGQGRRRRRRRGRLRRDDAGRGRGAARAARAGGRARAAGARPHAAPRQGGGHAARRSSSSRPRASRPRWSSSTTTTSSPSTRSWPRAAGRASRSTRARRWTSTGWSACSRSTGRSGSSSTRPATGACRTR